MKRVNRVIEVNGYEILKNAIKNDTFVNELKSKYGDDFVKNVQDYFNGVYDTSFLKDDVERKINDKLKDIMNMIYSHNIRNSNSHSSSNSSSNSSSSSSSSSDSSSEEIVDEDDHTMGNSYSSEIATSVLDEEIKRIDEDVRSLENAIKEVQLKDKKLRMELQRKKALLNILKGNRKQLNLSTSLDDSFKKQDDKLNDAYGDLDKKKKELNALNKMDVHNFRTKRIVDRKKIRLENEIRKLEAKIGIMKAKQRRVTNEKLKRIYSVSEKEAKKVGTDKARVMFRNERDQRLTETRNSIKNDMDKAGREVGSLNSGVGSVIKYTVSYHKYQVIEKYCSLLKMKDGVVDGLRQLPDTVKQAIKDNRDRLVVSSGYGR